MTHTRHYNDFEWKCSNQDGTDSRIAQKIIDMGLAKDFIALAVGMLNNPCCDLDGEVGRYAYHMQAIKRKAVHKIEEENEE